MLTTIGRRRYRPWRELRGADEAGGVKDAWQKLQEHSDTLLQSAKDQVRDVVSALPDPKQMDDALEPYASYSQWIPEERTVAIERRDKKVGEARSEMKRVAAAAPSSVQIEDVLAKYEVYGAYVRSERDKLKSLLFMTNTTAKERIGRLCKAEDIVAIDASLTEFAGYAAPILPPPLPPRPPLQPRV